MSNSDAGAVASTEGLGHDPERAAFEAHMDATAPSYWRTTAHAREAWAIWHAATGSERGRWQELAEHLRHCRDCGEEDVARCYSGAALWKAATGNDPKA